MINGKKSLLILVFSLFFASMSSASVTKKILILYALQPRMPAYEVLDQNFRNLQLDQGTQVEYYTEYLELSRFRDEGSIRRQADLINQRYKATPPDIVIAVMSPALDFIQKYCKATFNNTPIVYALIDKKVDPEKMEIKATGVHLHIDLNKTLTAALSIQPETRDVYVVAGTSALGRSWEAQAKEKFQPLSNHINFHYLSDLAMDEILHKVGKLTPKSIVLYLLIIKDASGKSFVPRDALNAISQSSSVPVYGLWSTYVGHGIIGGHLCSSDLLGKNVNKMVVRILNGDSIDTLSPISFGPSIYMFDWRQMKRFGISENRIPDDNIILFKTQTVWDKYRPYIIGFFLFALAQGILILFLAGNIKKRKIIETDLAYSKDRYKTLFQDSPIPLWEIDLTGVYDYFSRLEENGVSDFKSYFNETPSEVSNCAQKIKIIDVNQAALGLHKARDRKTLFENIDKIFTDESLRMFKKEIITLPQGKLEFESEGEAKTLSGEPRFIFIKIKIDQKNRGRTLISTTDLTGRKKIEESLRHAQKMESIGTLAGGIAHDFNNILSSIIGFSELALDGVEKGTEIEEDLQEVRMAGMRAKDLVKQILAFARQSDDVIQPTQVRIIAKEVLKFIKSSIPASIEITDRLNSDSFIMGSSTQIHQVLMNLCTNAAHAMEKNGGMLEVSLKDTKIDMMAIRPGLTPGDYIEIKVSDTGTGISPENIHNIFEPYFTTKPVDEGTGMGLAVVHGIVESYGGKIIVDSKVNKGTCFSIYLPITKKMEILPTDQEIKLPAGTENILFVDDEASIAKIGSKVLEQLGYVVTTRTSSVEALALFKSEPQAFDMVVTDMTMPNMTGEKLAGELMKIRSDIPVVLCTGYNKQISEESARDIGIMAFVYKPIVNADLANIVRTVLDKSKQVS